MSLPSLVNRDLNEETLTAQGRELEERFVVNETVLSENGLVAANTGQEKQIQEPNNVT